MKPRGMALILTLVFLGLLMMLAGAFLQLNSGSLFLGQAAEREQVATQAALTGYEYARMRLESNPNWGLPGSGTDTNLAVPGFQVSENDKFKPGEFACVGVCQGGRSHFQILFLTPGQIVPATLAGGQLDDADVEKRPTGTLASWKKIALQGSDVSLNYLGANRYAGTLKGTQSFGRALPRQRARVLVIGYSQGVHRRLDVTLGAESFTNAGIASGRDLVVMANHWNIDTKIDDTNRVQAEGHIILPGSAGNANRPNLKFRWGWLNDGGTAAASSSIRTGADGLRHVYPNGSHLDVVYSPNPVAPSDLSSTNAFVSGQIKPNSGVSQVPKLSAATVEKLCPFTNPRLIPGGTYTFTSKNEVTFTNSSGTVVYKDKIPALNGGDAVILKERQFIIPENTRVDANSSITIKSNGPSPTLAVGYNNGGWLDAAKKGAYFNVRDGGLTVAGSLVGKGSVVVNSTTDPDSASLQIQGTSEMAGSTDLGVTVFADGPIQVSAPNPIDANFFASDWEALSDAVKTYAHPSTWTSSTAPLKDWKDLDPAQRDSHTGGGLLTDELADSTKLKTTLIDESAANVSVTALTTAFAAYNVNATVKGEFDTLFTAFNTTDNGITTGEFIRLREFLRECQGAFDSGTTLPTSDLTSVAGNLSSWANVTDNNELVNQQLKAELGYFQTKFNAEQHSGNLEDCIKASSNPLISTENPRDARWKGLLYSNQYVLIDTNGGNFNLEGSLVGSTDVVIAHADKVLTWYDPSYFDALTQFDTGAGGLGTKLAPQFYCIY